MAAMFVTMLNILPKVLCLDSLKDSLDFNGVIDFAWYSSTSGSCNCRRTVISLCIETEGKINSLFYLNGSNLRCYNNRRC